MAEYDVLDLLILVILTIILTQVTIFLYKILIGNKKKNLPPLPASPRALPIIGHLHLLMGNKLPHKALAKVADRFGPIVYLRFGYKNCLLVSSADVARECLKTNELCFLNRPSRANFNYITYGRADFVLAPYGPFWKFVKKLTMSKLLGASMIEVYKPIRREEMKNLVETILKKANEGKAINVGAHIAGFTNNIISMMALKRKCANNDDELYEIRHILEEMLELAGKLNVQDFIWFLRSVDLQGFGKRLKNVRDRYDKLMGKIVEEHVEAKRKREERGCDGGSEVNGKDILDILLDVYEDESSEIKLTRENIYAFIMNLFGAGTDTTASTIEWALAELINHPKAISRARQEIDQVIGTERMVRESDIQSLPYIQAVAKETLRLHPAGPFIARESFVECLINGYRVPANTRLFISMCAVNRDPAHWESPNEFLPERFLGRDMDVRGQQFQFLPFGSGRRSCPGVNLAMSVVPTAVAVLVQCFDWRVGEDGNTNGVVDMEEGFGLSLPEAKPLVCFPVPRLNPFPHT